jgi:hypothetical protein
MAAGRRAERGVALVSTLRVTTLLTTLGAGLVLVAASETFVSTSHREARVTLYAADAALQRALADLRGLADWGAVLAAVPTNVRSTFDDGRTLAAAPDGRTLNLTRLTVGLQAASDAVFAGPAPDRPVWNVFAQGDLGRLAPGRPTTLPYVIVWVADDPADGDADATRDSNAVILLHAEAFGLSRARRTIDMTVARDATAALAGRTSIRVLTWRLGP